ncbi:MAG TPA: SDR family oxidoreductase [Candidatus Baltobacteraceae bacterium]|jgi:UDP-glucose 4-epimerase|nr:SDR family oxidoreductase [Candidatus Baltobacteraceae bacterium]
MATYLVTGAAGFIGSALVRALVERGERVRGVDNFKTGKRENLDGYWDAIEFYEIDINDFDRLGASFTGVDYVLHQAAIPSVPKSIADPVSSHRANIDGTFNVLLAAREANVRRVVYAASSSAYGNTPTLPKREDMKANPISPYAVQKLAGELYAAAFAQVYGMETVALRYFNVFGPRQDAASQYSGVLSKFITNMLQNRAPAIYGDGTQSRDFTYVDNVVSANLLAAAAPAENVAGRMFNVAMGQRHTLRAVFDMLSEIIGFSGEPRYEAERIGDVKHSLADIGAARAAIGYEPIVGLHEGLRRTVAWYRDQMLEEYSTRVRTAAS